jgi:hypothetical protein
MADEVEPRRRWRWVAALLITVVAAAVAFGLGRADQPGGPGRSAGAGPEPSPTTTQVLGGHGMGTGSATAAVVAGFTITGAVPALYPGARRGLVLIVTNPNRVPIRVVELSVHVADANPGCPGSLLSFGPLTPVTVPAHAQASARLDTGLSASAGDACRGVSWPLTYSGTAVTS